jgi:hypothetical protein
MSKPDKRCQLTGQCYYCGGTVGKNGWCTNCAAYIAMRGVHIEVSGDDATEVQQVARELSCALAQHRDRPPRPSPWFSGSFYLACAVVILAVILATARAVHPLVLPVVLIAALLLVSVVGAFQLRHDEKLCQKNFLSLMALSFKHLPHLRRGTKEEKDMSRPGAKDEEVTEHPPAN